MVVADRRTRMYSRVGRPFPRRRRPFVAAAGRPTALSVGCRLRTYAGRRPFLQLLPRRMFRRRRRRVRAVRPTFHHLPLFPSPRGPFRRRLKRETYRTFTLDEGSKKSGTKTHGAQAYAEPQMKHETDDGADTKHNPKNLKAELQTNFAIMTPHLFPPSTVVWRHANEGFARRVACGSEFGDGVSRKCWGC